MEFERNPLTDFAFMKSLLASMCFALIVETACPEEHIVKRAYNRYQGVEYELAIRQSDLQKAPKWEEGQENPPLSVRAAARLARAYVSRVVPDSGIDQIQSISLETAGTEKGSWIYVVSFWADPPDRRAIQLGALNTFKVIVLLNGFTPEAQVRKLPPQKTPPSKPVG